MYLAKQSNYHINRLRFKKEKTIASVWSSFKVFLIRTLKKLQPWYWNSSETPLQYYPFNLPWDNDGGQNCCPTNIQEATSWLEPSSLSSSSFSYRLGCQRRRMAAYKPLVSPAGRGWSSLMLHREWIDFIWVQPHQRCWPTSSRQQLQPAGWRFVGQLTGSVAVAEGSGRGCRGLWNHDPIYLNTGARGNGLQERSWWGTSAYKVSALPIWHFLFHCWSINQAGLIVEIKSYWNNTEVHCFTRREGAGWRGQRRYLMDTMKNQGAGAAAEDTNHHFFLGSLGAALPVRVSERTA